MGKRGVEESAEEGGRENVNENSNSGFLEDHQVVVRLPGGWKAFTKEMCRCYGQWTFGFDLRWAVASQALTLYMCIPSFLICGNFFKERRPRPSLNRSHAF